MLWTTNVPKRSKPSSKRMEPKYSWSIRMIIESMQQKGLSKHGKNHWLSGLGTLDPNCPLQLWCQFIEQGQDTLNMRIISRINNRLSAYAILDGQFEFDKTPLFSWIQKREHHGIHMQWMRSMSGPPKSITKTSSFTSPKRKDTE